MDAVGGPASTAPLGWLGIVRLGLVQSAIGAIVMLATSLLNRVMVVEYALPAALPAGLVAWHYAVQLARPAWGHGSDSGRRRTPWILTGMALLALGILLAIAALSWLAARSVFGFALALVAFSMIGGGVGAAGTSLLALLAVRVMPERRAAAASITWIMMIAGIAGTAGVAGALLEPFSLARLAAVGRGVAGVAFLVSIAALWGIEGEADLASAARAHMPATVPFRVALRELWGESDARRFVVFLFLSMFAYSMQELIIEPFAGLLFGFSPGRSTQLSGVQHGGVLLGMVLVGLGGTFGGGGAARMRRWVVGGCIGSAVALVGLAVAARVGPAWPLTANAGALGLANGVFSVAAIGAMMGLASAERGREGVRMGVWGAAQAIAFGLGGLIGAVGVDIGRVLIGSTPETFSIIFGVEALLFVCAAWRVPRPHVRAPPVVLVHGAPA